jgi:LacI family transcriptional regulator
MPRRLTIADVARKANVSQQTVSRVINNKGEISVETRARVMRIIEQLGYRPSNIARGLATQKTMTLGLIVPDVANPFFSEIARGADDAAHAAGYSLLLGNTIEDPQREITVLHALEERRVDGIVLCSSRLPDDQLAEFCARQPAVALVNRQIPGENVTRVCVDDAAGAQLAVRHLLQSNRRVIGFLAGPLASRSGQARARGYATALNDANISFDPTLSVPCPPFLDGGRTAAHALLSARPDVSALFCYNDLVAAGALQACADLGRRVPGDVAIIGVDDIPISAIVTPSLTTLHVSQREIGATTTRLLLANLQGRTDIPRDIVITPQLVIRASAP